MPVWILVLFAVIVMQRLVELWIAKHNEKWLKKEGAIEVGKKHYKWFIVLHVTFFIAILFEMRVMNHVANGINPYLFVLFILTQIGRAWCISALGTRWNTKIIVLSDDKRITKGPYKYVSHPNYIVVGLELCIIPLLFGAYISAVLFPLLHILLLTVRIPVENRALNNISTSANTTSTLRDDPRE